MEPYLHNPKKHEFSAQSSGDLPYSYPTVISVVIFFFILFAQVFIGCLSLWYLDKNIKCLHWPAVCAQGCLQELS